MVDVFSSKRSWTIAVAAVWTLVSAVRGGFGTSGALAALFLPSRILAAIAATAPMSAIRAVSAGNSGTFKTLEHLGGRFPSDECDADVDPIGTFEVTGQKKDTRSRERSHPPVADAGLAREERIDD